MQLYEKITSPSGRVTYREYNPATEFISDKEIEQDQVITILCTLVISVMMSISGQLAPHSKLHREIRLVEQSVLRFAQLAGTKLEPKFIEVGVMAWNAAIKAVQSGLSRLPL
jgi:hypothetical protein